MARQAAGNMQLQPHNGNHAMNNGRLSLAILLSLTAAWLSPLDAEDWGQFRGATGDGVSAEEDVPARWTDGEGVAWSVDLSGRGNSSPVVVGDRVDVTSQREDNSLWVTSLDRSSGRLIRSVRVGSGRLAAKGSANLYAHRHNAATPTPVADEKHTWAFFGSGLLVCLDAASGKVSWQRDMVKDFGGYDITFGMGSSPRLWGDLLYISCLTKGASYVVALDKNSGEVVWHSKRQLPAKDDGPDAYSTPTIRQLGKTAELLVSGSDHVNAYDLLSGKQNWVSDGMAIDSAYGRIIASPVAHQGIVIATSANPGGGGKGRVIAVRGNGSGNVSETHRAWSLEKSSPDSSSPVCLDGRVYMTADNGVAQCVDIKSGTVHWTKRLSMGPYHASLVAGDGKVYFLAIDGTCTVIAAGDEPQVVSINKLSGTFYSTPAISHGTIFLRAYERLVAIDGK